MDEPDAAWFGTYLYHPDTRAGWGDNLYWGEAGKLVRDHWYEIEMEITMNTPGEPNGVLLGWIDGQTALERRDIRFRDPGHDGLHARTIWLDIYKGGGEGNCADHHVYLDQMLLARERPGS